VTVVNVNHANSDTHAHTTSDDKDVHAHTQKPDEERDISDDDLPVVDIDLRF
jgi:hypothetical protein